MKSYEDDSYIDDIFDLCRTDKFCGEPETICRKLISPMTYWRLRYYGMFVGVLCLALDIFSAISIWETLGY